MPIFLPGLQCTGSEETIAACPDFQLGQVRIICRHNVDVYLVCYNGPNAGAALMQSTGHAEHIHLQFKSSYVSPRCRTRWSEWLHRSERARPPSSQVNACTPLFTYTCTFACIDNMNTCGKPDNTSHPHVIIYITLHYTCSAAAAAALIMTQSSSMPTYPTTSRHHPR